MSETKHSPLPWTVEGPDMFGDYNILQPGTTLAVGAIVSNLRPSEEVAANAAFIVLATSLHHEMVSALEAAVKMNRAFGESSKNQAAAYYAFVDRKYAIWYDIEAVLAKAKPLNLDEPRG